ncbi:MAG: hypothetical protein IPN63_07830 [Gammaproteobacteria bacterium]|nr:hypothetical protein [Gammaproteobacteria bacterium]
MSAQRCIEIQSTCAPSFSKVRDAFIQRLGRFVWLGRYQARFSAWRYAMNQMDTIIFGDPRGVRLIDAVYGCLPRSQEMFLLMADHRRRS